MVLKRQAGLPVAASSAAMKQPVLWLVQELAPMITLPLATVGPPSSDRWSAISAALRTAVSHINAPGFEFSATMWPSAMGAITLSSQKTKNKTKKKQTTTPNNKRRTYF